jgi:hypothetical protein
MRVAAWDRLKVLERIIDNGASDADKIRALDVLLKHGLPAQTELNATVSAQVLPDERADIYVPLLKAGTEDARVLPGLPNGGKLLAPND